jgi:uncharacterized membrane protein
VVRAETAAEEAFIQRVAVAVAVGPVLVSIAFLIYFINHASRSIQVSVIQNRLAARGSRRGALVMAV